MVNSLMSPVRSRLPRSLIRRLQVRAVPRLELPRMRLSEFERLSRYFEQQLGLHFDTSKRALLANRLAGRLRNLKLSSFSDYYRLITSVQGLKERHHAFDLVATHETSFFREIAHFRYLSELLSTWKHHRAVRIWDAACASGEEAYSIAMVASERLGNDKSRWKLLATDVGRSMISNARRGIYPNGQLQAIPEQYRKPYLQRGIRAHEGTFRIRPEFARLIEFNIVNLLQIPTLPAPFDIVFLRNTLIYMSDPVRTRIIESVASRLTARGILFTSQTESLKGRGMGFQFLAPGIHALAQGDDNV